MAKQKTNVSHLETIETYFTNGNDHTNKFYFKVYKEAKEQDLFKDLLIPLSLLNELSNKCYTGRNKPLQAINSIKDILSKASLNDEQKSFIVSELKTYLEESVWTDETGKEIQLTQIENLIEDEFFTLLYGIKDEPSTAQSSYSLEAVKKHLETLPGIKEKIKYLVEVKTDYQQNKEGLEFDFAMPFDKQIELEIKKLRAILELQPTAPVQKTETVTSNFKLRESILSKADFIRIVNALSELKAFELTNTNELTPNKKDVMIAFGNLVGIDLSNYPADLSKALRQSEQANIEIFEKMKTKAVNLWYETLKKVSK